MVTVTRDSVYDFWNSYICETYMVVVDNALGISVECIA